MLVPLFVAIDVILGLLFLISIFDPISSPSVLDIAVTLLTEEMLGRASPLNPKESII